MFIVILLKERQTQTELANFCFLSAIVTKNTLCKKNMKEMQEIGCPLKKEKTCFSNNTNNENNVVVCFLYMFFKKNNLILFLFS